MEAIVRAYVQNLLHPLDLSTSLLSKHSDHMADITQVPDL